MNEVGVIDRFLAVFTQYIDSGFGLLSGEVAFLATTLIVIDVTLSALFWTWAADDDVLARLVKKTLFVGVFAYIIGNWNGLAQIVFESFAGLGLQASGGSVSAADFVRPGRIAQVGIDAGRPLLESISELMGFVSFFENAVQIVVILFAWVLVILSFFILAIQLFVTLIEFKLTTLAGFVLIPFGLFGKTAFLAERVLGNVISSGVKVLVLAVIVGIGSTLFSEFTANFAGEQPTIEEAMAIVLASLSLLGLGIFGPGIANGIVSGGPQLSAGAAVGTGLAAGGVVAAGVGAVRMGAGAVAGMARGRSHRRRDHRPAYARPVERFGWTGRERPFGRRLRTERPGTNRRRRERFGQADIRARARTFLQALRCAWRERAGFGWNGEGRSRGSVRLERSRERVSVAQRRARLGQAHAPRSGAQVRRVRRHPRRPVWRPRRLGHLRFRQ